MDNPKVYDFLDEVFADLKDHLIKDEERYGDTWLHRTKDGQEYRIEKKFNDYFDQYRYAGVPVDWLSVLGNAAIARIRETHPELFPE